MSQHNETLRITQSAYSALRSILTKNYDHFPININKLAFVICTECVLSEIRNEILHENVTYMTVRIITVQIDLTRPSLNIHECSKILGFKVKKALSDNVVQNQLDEQGFISSTDRG